MGCVGLRGLGFRIDGLGASISRIVGKQIENVEENCLGTGWHGGCNGLYRAYSARIWFWDPFYESFIRTVMECRWHVGLGYKWVTWGSSMHMQYT